MSTATDFFVNLEDNTSFNLFIPHNEKTLFSVYSKPYGEGESTETILRSKNEVLTYAYSKRDKMPAWVFEALRQFVFDAD